MSLCHRRNFIPKVVGSACTPCVRPMTGVRWYLRACASSVPSSLRQSAIRISIAWRMLIA